MDTQFKSAVSLYTFIVLGVFLLFAPWTMLWQQASLAILPEPMAEYLLSGWIRGCVSALGFLDLWVALQVGREIWGQVAGRHRQRAAKSHFPGVD